MAYTGDKKREYQREWLARRRIRAIAMLGGSCVWCGSCENLEFDHIDPRTKDPRIRGVCGFPFSWSWNRIEVELAKCWILCHDCHRVKTRDDQPDVLHGTEAMYKRYICRCSRCRSWSAKDRAYYRAKKQAKIEGISFTKQVSRARNVI